METYDHQVIEQKWRSIWKDQRTYSTDTSDQSKPKWYNLVMFPYPSGDLHIGHWYNFAPADVLARFKRMQGYNVLNPIGFDAFGLPAENAAIKRNIHPFDWTKQNVQNMIAQLETMGPSYDWDRVLSSADPEYYKWTQWCFLQLYERGLAYKKQAAANWCPTCKSVLANEQAEGGVCWRCGSQVEQRMINQWFFKITDYADELQSAVDALEWPEKIKLMQKNWIGKSAGANIKFQVASDNPAETKFIEVFSTRADTLLGATFIVLAPEHPLVLDVTTESQQREVEHYQQATAKRTEFERISQKERKTGAFTGSYAINPINQERIPIWISDFVIATYAHGAIMGVPAHDERDYQFAKTHELPIKFIAQASQVTSLVVNKSVKNTCFAQLEERVGYYMQPFSTWGTLVHFDIDSVGEYQKIIQENLEDGPWYVHTDGKARIAIFKNKVVPADPDGSWTTAKQYGLEQKIIESALDFTIPEEGFAKPITQKENLYLINSGSYSGLSATQTVEQITQQLVQSGSGSLHTQYRLRDWLVSRQRYWGAPVPIINCPTCGVVPVPVSDLPVVLPYDVDYTPQETSPLGSSPEFFNTTCPKCNSPATRDTDTLDTFVDSSWYFLRFLDPTNPQYPFPGTSLHAPGEQQPIANHWMPVDMYIGGAEHAVLHLLYARFFVKVFRDLGYLNFDEPFQRLFNQGTILGPDHQKMSKSKGNVISPDELVMHYGADAVRVYLCFLGPFDQGGPWNPSGIEGAARFIRKLHLLITQNSEQALSPSDAQAVEVSLHRLIKKITQDLPNLKFNTSIAAFMEFINTAQPIGLSLNQKRTVLQLIAPFCPFLSEELWHTVLNKSLADSIHHSSWPEYDPSLLIESEVEVVVQINSKVRAHLLVPRDTTQSTVQQAALDHPKVIEHLGSLELKKVIFVPNKLINLIAS